MIKIISFIVGILLSVLFGYVIKKRNCIVVDTEYIENLKNSSYKHNGKCYTFKEESTTCDANKKNIQIA